MTPGDVEKWVFLESDGEDEATAADFEDMRQTCSMYGSRPASVLDAEGRIVCIAPLDIARLIARLLNKSDEVGL